MIWMLIADPMADLFQALDISLFHIWCTREPVMCTPASGILMQSRLWRKTWLQTVFLTAAPFTKETTDKYVLSWVVSYWFYIKCLQNIDVVSYLSPLVADLGGSCSYSYAFIYYYQQNSYKWFVTSERTNCFSYTCHMMYKFRPSLLKYPVLSVNCPHYCQIQISLKSKIKGTQCPQVCFTCI